MSDIKNLKNSDVKNSKLIIIKSEEFKTIFQQIISTDVIYGNSSKYLDIVNKSFSDEILEIGELKIIRRILGESDIIKKLAKLITKDQYNLLVSFGIKSESYNCDKFNEEDTRLLIASTLLSEFYLILKGKVIGNEVKKGSLKVDEILTYVDEIETIEITSGKRIKLLKTHRFDYQLYDLETQSFLDLDEMDVVIKNGRDVCYLQNGDKAIVLICDGGMSSVFFSLDLGKIISGNIFPLDLDTDKNSDYMVKDNMTIVFAGKSCSFKYNPYCLETQEYLDPELYKMPESRMILGDISEMFDLEKA